MRNVHVITPGDHFSPLTGSAIPTVVHGLATHASSDEQRPAVAVARGTNPVRYPSADILEYEPATPIRMPRGIAPTRVDAVVARLGIPRFLSRRLLAAVVRDQVTWPPSRVLAHNSPQLVPLVNRSQHVPYLYAHNEVLKTYTEKEAGRILGSVAGVICVSHFLGGRTAERLPVGLRDRVRVVHNGVDTDFFRRLAPLRESDALRIVFVSRMIPEKGADVLLRALKEIGRPDIHVTLIGSQGFDASASISSYESSIRSLASELGDRATVRPFLPREEVRDALGSADVVVVPSRWADPFPLTVYEGMASGAAVVGSDIGGIPEALKGRGLLVKPGDPRSLAEALEALADDNELLAQLAAAGRAHTEVHDWSHAARALRTTIEELG